MYRIKKALSANVSHVENEKVKNKGMRRSKSQKMKSKEDKA
jgi:hypothetical protein